MINADSWIKNRIKKEQIDKYLDRKKCFIDEDAITAELSIKRANDSSHIHDILQKSLSIQTLNLAESAALLRVDDSSLLGQMEDTALKVKKKVYDNRIVVFAPLYMGNFCVNDCLYCGFRKSNTGAQRKILSMDEIKAEVKILAGDIGHKRLIVVYGEHPCCDINYMCESIKEIYSVKAKTKKGTAQIRRVNVNASPLAIEELKKLREAGIGTYQVFQETYHQKTYEKLHPQNTIKGDYLWRLYAMHRAFEAKIDDVGLGALFGLYDWKFECLGLIAHNLELEKKFGVGAHTISVPRLEPATNTPYTEKPKYKVSDRDFKKLITVLRLAIPHTGIIITCRETAQMKKDSLALGITQTDASSKIGIGAYSQNNNKQIGKSQQFILGDTRSLDEVIGEFAQLGYITSFCTAGYRCGRTGKCIMELLRSGAEGKFCKLNAVITFREWLDDFASEETRRAAEGIVNREIEEIKQAAPKTFSQFMNYYQRTKSGERDLYF